jgi:hypothetical protein
VNGNVTEEGIELDLRWLKRIGIGGVQNFDGWSAPTDTSLIVQEPLIYMSPPWWQSFRKSVQLASELDLEFTIASSAGWTTTGGPWVPPQDGMKKLVWSETWVEGGKPLKGPLKSPPATTGAFQDIPVSLLNRHWRENSPPIYYVDIATLAYRAPLSEAPPANLNAQVTSSAGPMEAAFLVDGDLAHTVALPFAEARSAWIQFAFETPQSARALTYVVARPAAHPLQESSPRGHIEVSDDGKRFRKIVDLPQTGVLESSALEQTISFAPTSARVFRIVLERPDGAAKDFSYPITELALHTAARVNRFEDKAGFSSRQIRAQDDTLTVDAASVIGKHDVFDLTAKMRADGSLDWTPPAGRWVVLRFGYSLTGKTNDPASPAGTGLEVDKLDRDAVKRYMDAYLGRFEQALGGDLMGQKGLRSIVVDSYEAGPQNWTERILDEFKARRGYDLRPWLPVLAGRVIESATASDKLLWDFRKTLAELMRDAHYEQITKSAHERGLARYGESHEFGRSMIGDGMQMKRSADIPMGAMWAGLPKGLDYNYAADLRESASVAHLYGQNLVAAESFTSGNPYGFAPEHLKPVADRMMSEGVNRFVIHTSVHQPDSRPGPGLGLGIFGQWFTRKETWAHQAEGWVAYLARSSYLLSQGQFVADIAYLYGEDTNVTALFHASAPSIPEGYSFDFVNADALLNELTVKNGALVSRSGMTYRVLAVDASTQRMSLPVLRKIRELVRQGAIVVGPRPKRTPSLADDEESFRTIANELWGNAASTSPGHIVLDRPLGDVLRVSGILPDVTFRHAADATLRFVHRKLADGDLYFVSNASAKPQRVEGSFRLSGRRPEAWHADTGAISAISYRMDSGRTHVPLELDPHGALFIVFREPTDLPATHVPQPKRVAIATLAGPWEVSFPPHLGAPALARFEQLQSWTDRPESGIKYFSGTATYSTRFAIHTRALKSGARVDIDLGQVKNLAEVRVNGQSLGILWKAPFRVDITEALKVGDNALEIDVTNLWPNRLIGDKQPHAQQVAYASYDPFKADSPLLPSGLLGPVTLWSKVVERDRR